MLLYPQEKEILYVRSAIDLARDLGIGDRAGSGGLSRLLPEPVREPGLWVAGVRVAHKKSFPERGFSRSLAPGAAEDCTKWPSTPQDRGVILALQTHPEITGNNEETLALIEEVNVPSLKVGVDLPLLENFDPDFVRKTVLSMKGLMVYSHTISLAKSATVGGAPYSWEEVTPGSPKDKLPWEVFLTACKDIGYDGFLSHEQCSPIIVKGHQLGGLDTVDERYVDARNYFPRLLDKLGCYSGHKPSAVPVGAHA